MSGPLYRLFKHGCGYYRFGGHGYTVLLDEAGIFSEEYSSSEVHSCHGEVVRELVSTRLIEEGSYILASNLEAALETALDAMAQWETKQGYTRPSCQRAAWELNLVYLKRHGTLNIRPS